MASQIKYHCVLALPIFDYSFPQLITMETCNEYRKSFPQSNTSNVQAWHSGYYTHDTTNVFNPLINTTLSKCYDVTEQHLSTDITTNSDEYFVSNLWVAMYEKNDRTLMHHHFPYHFAACYYVDVEDDCSPITFGDCNGIDIQPENGMLLIWNGIVPHMVAPTNKKRTCICMNISMRSKRKAPTDSIPIFY